METRREVIKRTSLLTGPRLRLPLAPAACLLLVFVAASVGGARPQDDVASAMTEYGAAARSAARCGANMIGHKTSHGSYYVCGSQPYRRGKGCGEAVSVLKECVEKNIVEGMQELVSACGGPNGFTRQINEELRRIWESTTGHDPDAEKKTAAVDAKLQNVHRAIEDGLAETAWADERLRELKAQRERFVAASEVSGEPPQIDAATAMTCRRDLPKLIEHATRAEKKELIRAWVEGMRLAPERLEVEITYRRG